MVYHGKVANGVVVLDRPGLPDGTEVRVEPVNGKEPGKSLLSVAGIADGPPDLAAQHDHYAHGKPKS